MSDNMASKPMGIRRVQISRESDMPSDCAATPGKTIEIVLTEFIFR